MEGIIASWYAKTTVRDINRHKLAAARVARIFLPGSSVLEIAPGPGYFCIELAKLGNYRITGLDISQTFIEICRRNAAEAGTPVEFKLGNASDIPFETGSFDLTFCQAAFKNFSQPVKAISEMYRVLRPNGTAIILDMRHDATNEDIELELDKMRLGPVNRFLTRGSFRGMLRKNAYTVSEMEAMIAQTPFGRGKFDLDGIGFQVSLHKTP